MSAQPSFPVEIQIYQGGVVVEVKSVPGFYLNAPFAVTGSLRDDETELYAVTHIPTGFRAGRGRPYEDACALTDALAEQPEWWGLPERLHNPFAWQGDEKSKFKKLYLQALRAAGLKT